MYGIPRGVPVDMHPGLKYPDTGNIYTPSCRGKFGQNNYEYSGGLHGVGAAAVVKVDGSRQL